MPAREPSAHAARAGAWALLVALAVQLAFDLARRAALAAVFRSDDPLGSDWFRWLMWLGDADLPLRAALAALVVTALVRLARGTSDAVARVMFLGAGVLALLEVGWLLGFAAMTTRDAEATQAIVRAFLPITIGLERLGVGLLLAAIWRARRARGQGAGPAWSIAALMFALRLAMLVGVVALGPTETAAADAVRRELMLVAFLVTELGAVMAALLAFARRAPAEPGAGRLRAAAAGLDTYFRALVARVTIVGVGAVVTLAFGLTSPATRGELLFGVLALALPAVLVQVAGLTRYADAPTPIARGWLGLGLAAMGLGLALEIVTLTLFAAALWGERGFDEARVDASVLASLGGYGQLVALVAGLALLLSLRRAAVGLEAPALARRATRLGAAMVAVVAVVAGLTRLLGAGAGPGPWLVAVIGLVALVVGVALFVSWLRLVEGVAAALRARAG